MLDTYVGILHFILPSAAALQRPECSVLYMYNNNVSIKNYSILVFKCFGVFIDFISIDLIFIDLGLEHGFKGPCDKERIKVGN